MTGSVRIRRRPTNALDGGPWPFQTDADVMAFAKRFLRDRARGFKKDIDICLTGKSDHRGKLTHAYMPALLLCFSFIDLLSGLYAGRIHGHGLEHFLAYMRAFMPPNRYSNHDLKILYIGFRHKIAHLSHPYFVLDTASDKRIDGTRRLIGWTIYASRRAKALELVPLQAQQLIDSRPTPWQVQYDHIVRVSIPMIAADARKSLWGPKGYVAELGARGDLKSNFKKCMKEFYPK